MQVNAISKCPQLFGVALSHHEAHHIIHTFARQPLHTNRMCYGACMLQTLWQLATGVLPRLVQIRGNASLLKSMQSAICC